MCIELAKTTSRFESQRAFGVEYDGVPIGLSYRVDLLVDDVVIVEIKAVEKIVPLHESQLLHYLRLSKRRVGLLINFNVARLKDGIRRRVC
jgi:GxxExxY protein